MLISTCWIAFFYCLKRYVNNKNVTNIIGYKNNDVLGTNLNLKYLNVINYIKNDYERIELTFWMNNKLFKYTALSDEFTWPIKDNYEHTWIYGAYLTCNDNIDTFIDVTNAVNMYAGPKRNFYDCNFDFKWIPEIAISLADQLCIYDKNENEYIIDLKTNETSDSQNLLQSVFGVKLLPNLNIK